MTPPLPGLRLERRISVDQDNLDTSARYNASLSSELPYDRGDYIEVLDHSIEAVDMERAAKGLPLLFDHQPSRPVGRAHNVRLSGRRLRAELQIAGNPDGESVRALLDTGHDGLSIGYQVLAWEQRGMQDGKPIMRATRWRPFEVSVVSVPADHEVGIGRSATFTKGNHTMENMTRSQRRNAAAQDNPYADIQSSDAATIAAIGDQFKPQGGVEMAMAAIQRGDSVEQFRSHLMTRLSESSRPVDLRGSYHERGSSYSLARAIHSQVDPGSGVGGYEREVSQDLARRSGIKTNGLIVPFEVVFGSMARAIRAEQFKRDLFTGGQGSSTIQTTVDGAAWIDVLRKKSTVVAMGARTLTNLTDNVNLPRAATPTAAGWLGEKDASNETTPTIDEVELRPHRIGAYVDISRQLAMQSVVDIEGWISQDLSQTLIDELDRVALLGSGQNFQPLGIFNTVGINTVSGATNGSQLAFEHILKLEQAVADKDALVDVGAAGYIVNPASRSWLKRQPKVAGLDSLVWETWPLQDGEMLNGYKAMVTTKLPNDGTKGTGTALSSLVFGDFSQLIVATFGSGIEILVDPYTLSRNAQIRITANLFADVAVRHPESFAVMTDAKTA